VAAADKVFQVVVLVAAAVVAQVVLAQVQQQQAQQTQVAVAVQAIRAQQAAAESFTSEWKFNHGCTIFCTIRRQQHCYKRSRCNSRIYGSKPTTLHRHLD
jgi:type II secretory pathway pseudopilin PulG